MPKPKNDKTKQKEAAESKQGILKFKAEMVKARLALAAAREAAKGLPTSAGRSYYKEQCENHLSLANDNFDEVDGKNSYFYYIEHPDQIAKR